MSAIPSVCTDEDTGVYTRRWQGLLVDYFRQRHLFVRRLMDLMDCFEYLSIYHSYMGFMDAKVYFF